MASMISTLVSWLDPLRWMAVGHRFAFKARDRRGMEYLLLAAIHLDRISVLQPDLMP